jgi:hypothetical protein
MSGSAAGRGEWKDCGSGLRRMEFDFPGSGFGRSFGIKSMQTVSNLTSAG